MALVLVAAPRTLTLSATLNLTLNQTSAITLIDSDALRTGVTRLRTVRAICELCLCTCVYSMNAALHVCHHRGAY